MVENSEQIKTLMPWKPGGSTSLDKKCLTTIVTSYFVQVLLNQICFVSEPDNQQWHNLYNKICQVMLQLKLIDQIYKISDLPKTKRNVIAIANQLKKIITSLESYKIKPTIHTTLLVETVLEVLWAIVEPDRDNIGNIDSQMKKFLHLASLSRSSCAMEGLQMIRHEYKKILHHLFLIVRDGNIMCGMFSSRYIREFEEVNEKGSGGYGEVFSAKNRLDKVFYAIKKIKCTTCDDMLQHLTEVRTLASLNHPNIVSLNAVWVEGSLATHGQITDGSDDISNSCSTVLQSSQSDDCVESKSSGSLVSKFDSQIVLNYSKSKFNTDPFKPQIRLKWILFIQMPLYQKTLKDFLLEQNGKPLCINVVENIFMQLINGLNHAHNQRIIHHDIKPNNILVNINPNKNVHVCLADFGLACKSQKGHTGEGFGTPLYAAPEQRKGQCNDRSDIYALGIILLELLVPISTEMELSRTIEGISLKKFPGVNKNYRKLLKRLMNCSPEQRPSIKQLRNFVYKTMSYKKQKFKQLQKKNHQLKAELDEKKLELFIMKKELDITKQNP